MKRLSSGLLVLIFFCSLPLIANAKERSILHLITGILGSVSPLAPAPPPIPGKGHDSITTWRGTATCLTCHTTEAREMFSSVHYQWLGKTPYMTNGPSVQGKLDLGVNSYCINITGNWNGCGACHVGLGARPQTKETVTQLRNIDCMVCHQEGYKRKKVNGVFVPDLDNMSISMVKAAQTVHKPTRTNCLQCHAKGGGGDNYKRGDMALAHGNTSDKNFDVHMATTGANLSCRSCHTTEKHRIAGRGSDLRPTDLDKEINCRKCHEPNESKKLHDNRSIETHLARVACQSCHIPTYARNASDTAASEVTETHRDWRQFVVTASGALHPKPTKAGNLTPKYKWWDGRSNNYLLNDIIKIDPATKKIPTSRPLGSISNSNSKLYPFKYKTATQPVATNKKLLIALDTSVFFTSGDADAATLSGLTNMGLSTSESYNWQQTDTYQLITHEIAPSSRAVQCNSCHDNTSRMDLQNQLGYGLKGSVATVCVQCHKYEKPEKDGYKWIHEEHVEEKRYDCSWCHSFTRPERGLRLTRGDDD